MMFDFWRLEKQETGDRERDVDNLNVLVMNRSLFLSGLVSAVFALRLYTDQSLMNLCCQFLCFLNVFFACAYFNN